MSSEAKNHQVGDANEMILSAPSVDGEGGGAECQRELMAAGKTYPRTCAACGLIGPCRKGILWSPTGQPTELVHYATTPFVAVCGADIPNQRTTNTPFCVTCYVCSNRIQQSVAALAGIDEPAKWVAEAHHLRVFADTVRQADDLRGELYAKRKESREGWQANEDADENFNCAVSNALYLLDKAMPSDETLVGLLRQDNDGMHSVGGLAATVSPAPPAPPAVAGDGREVVERVAKLIGYDLVAAKYRPGQCYGTTLDAFAARIESDAARLSTAAAELATARATIAERDATIAAGLESSSAGLRALLAKRDATIAAQHADLQSSVAAMASAIEVFDRSEVMTKELKAERDRLEKVELAANLVAANHFDPDENAVGHFRMVRTSLLEGLLAALAAPTPPTPEADATRGNQTEHTEPK